MFDDWSDYWFMISITKISKLYWRLKEQFACDYLCAYCKKVTDYKGQCSDSYFPIQL